MEQNFIEETVLYTVVVRMIKPIDARPIYPCTEMLSS